MTKNTSIHGTGWSFPPEFVKDEKNGVVMTSGVEDINRSLEILFTTQPGERIMQESYGSDLSEFVHAPMNATNLTRIKRVIETAIRRHEPRIVLNTVNLRPDQAEGLILIDLVYTVRSTNSRFNLVFPFYLNEATNVEL